MTKLQDELIQWLKKDIINATYYLAYVLDIAFKGLETTVYRNKIKLFVNAQKFTQLSSNLGATRHVGWYEYFEQNKFPIEFNSPSDLLLNYEEEKILIEVKGSGNARGVYDPIQGGKYTKFEEERLFLLSQEQYDIDNLKLNKIRVVVTSVNSRQFKDSSGNRTNLGYNFLKNGGHVLAEHEIDFNRQRQLFMCA